MHKALHPREDVGKLYVSRKEGGRGLACIEYSIDASIWLEVYIENTKEDWLQPSKMILTTRWTTKWQLRNKNGKKNNSIGVLND